MRIFLNFPKTTTANMKELITSVTFILLGLGGLHAQEIVTATGSEATGTGGTASYTVGQVVYTTNIGTNGSVVSTPFTALLNWFTAL